MSKMKISLCTGGIAILGSLATYWISAQAATPKSDPVAVSIARNQTEMLDTLYKTAIVAVTQTYVKNDSSTAAATTFQPVFAAMKKGKFHTVRLVDGLGSPVNPDNSPMDDFEKESMVAILKGDAKVERIESVDGQEVLRTMTSLPMVMDKCVFCHDNYKDEKIIGGVSYIVPIPKLTH